MALPCSNARRLPVATPKNGMVSWAVRAGRHGAPVHLEGHFLFRDIIQDLLLHV
jgi:hypothetical protein